MRASGLSILAAIGIVVFAGCAPRPRPATAATTAATPPTVATTQFTPLFDRATLELHGDVRRPVSVATFVENVHDAAGARIVVAGDTVSQIDAAGHELWQVKTPDGSQLDWQAAGGTIMYLSGYRTVRGDNERHDDSPVQLRRLDLATRNWLPPLQLASNQKKPTGAQEIARVLADRDRVAVLISEAADNAGENAGHIAAYRLAFFRGRSATPAWSKVFPASGARQEPGVLLWAASKPDFAGASLVQLSWFDTGILMCAGEKEDIVDLDADGKILWRVSRIWEYQRGFVGPSVWSHYIERFGLDEWAVRAVNLAEHPSAEDKNKPPDPDRLKEIADTRKALADARAAFQRNYDCGIVAGPVIVPPLGEAGQGSTHLLVVVARGPNAPYCGYLSDAIVYELAPEFYEPDEPDLRPSALANLPRMVLGDTFSTVPGGVIWSCQQGAMVRLGTTERGAGIFGPDLICDVAWYRQFNAPPVAAWLSADKAADATAFGRTHAFHIAGGGYVLTKRDKVYCFPIECIDLENGASESMTLTVPFEGKLSQPTENYSGNDQGVHAFGPYKLGVTGLTLRGSTLEMVLGIEKSARTVSFDVGKWLQDAPR